MTDAADRITARLPPEPSTNGQQFEPLVEDFRLAGDAFILDQPQELQARIGRGGEVLWSQGESLIIAGPTGVGKTTLAGEIVAALLGISDQVLGYPVMPARK